MIRRTRWLLAGALTLTSVGGAALAADGVLGSWTTVDDKSGKARSVVEVYEQGGRVFGRIARLMEPNDEQGKPKVCRKCTGEDKDKPLVGLVIIRDLARDGDRLRGGTVLDPENGKTYRAEVWPEGGTLKVRGYLGPFYRTQTWLR